MGGSSDFHVIAAALAQFKPLVDSDGVEYFMVSIGADVFHRIIDGLFIAAQCEE